VSSFRFGLQKVLDLRERDEQTRARALAAAERSAREAEAHLDLIQRIRGEEAEKLLKTHARGQTVGHLRNLGIVINQMSRQVDEAEKAVRAAAEQVEESRTELVTSMQKRRMLDQLKTRQHDGWRVEQAETERKEMDEIALGIFQRKSATEAGRPS
jgi:flagellar protein FliJ